jgi:hypothetical protein
MSEVVKISVGRRSDFYRSTRFKRGVADILRREPRDVALCIDSLLEAGHVASAGVDMPAAIAVSSDAATILAAVASQQRRPASVVRVAARIIAMSLQFEIGRPSGPAAAGEPPPPAETFGGELANLFRHLWSNGENGSAGRTLPFLTVCWNEGGTALFGTTDHSQAGRGKRLFSSVRLPVPLGGGAGNWDFVRLPTVGGSLFSPPSIAGFGELAGEILRNTLGEDDEA